jgi:hypothetical protein
MIEYQKNVMTRDDRMEVIFSTGIFSADDTTNPIGAMLVALLAFSEKEISKQDCYINVTKHLKTLKELLIIVFQSAVSNF